MAIGADIELTGTHSGAFESVLMPLHSMDLPADDVAHLWYLNLSQLGGSLHHALGADDDPAPPQRLPAGQLKFVRRFYLRLLLGAYLGLPGKNVEILRSPRGKPALDYSVHKSNLHFSMAKSEDNLLIGVSSSTHIGVDLEPVSRRAHKPMRVAQRYFSSDESESLKQVPAAALDQAFLRAWACKEAVVKASGRGIANQLCRFSVEVCPQRTPAVLHIDEDDASQWSLAVVRPDEYFLGAVAVRQPKLKIACFKLLPRA